MYDSNEFFKTYFNNASEKSLLIELMYTRFFPPKHTLDILDLGCHDGALIKKIIAAYEDRMPPKVTLTGVEPSLEASIRYAENHFNIPVQTHTFIGTAENYFTQNTDGKYFDWVIASQCLYWSSDLLYIIKQIADCGESGLIVFRGHRGIYEIQSRFKFYIGNPNEQFYTADNIEAALISLTIPYEKQVETTSIQLPPQGSLEMKWLIAFFLQQNDKDMDNNICQEVEAWILAKNSEKIIHEVCFFWLGKARDKINTKSCAVTKVFL